MKSLPVKQYDRQKKNKIETDGFQNNRERQFSGTTVEPDFFCLAFASEKKSDDETSR